MSLKNVIKYFRNYNVILFVCFLSVLSTVINTYATTHQQLEKPNIVFIISDDHGYADMTHLNIHDNVRTPNLDLLASQSINFNQAYVSSPICSPSRPGFLTGRNQARWGAEWYRNASLTEDYPTIAEQLADLGYTTGFIDKANYGGQSDRPDRRGFPPNHGFDHSFFSLSGGRVHYLYNSAEASSSVDEVVARRMSMQPLWENDSQTYHSGFLTHTFSDRAQNFISDHADDEQPFFLMLSFTAVHNFTWQLPQEKLDRYNLPGFNDWDGSTNYLDWYGTAIWPELPYGRDYYLAQLELLDDEIGRDQ